MDWGSGAFIVSAIIVAVGLFAAIGMIALYGEFAAEEHDESQLQRLLNEYLKLLRKYESRYGNYDCGRTLAEHICVDLSEWGRRMREIEVEVDTIVKEERAHGTDPFVKMGRL